MTDYKKLQNGSDVRGIALAGVEGEQVNLTPGIACDIAHAFALWLSTKKNKPVENLQVAVGRDSRLSGKDLMEGVFEGLTTLGVTVHDCNMASTPAMFMSTVLPEFCFDGSIMITASHLPWNRNGLKFFTCEGGLEHEDIAEILSSTKEIHAAANVQLVNACSLIDSYSTYLCEVIKQGIGSKTDYDRPLNGFKIAVDAGNGAGGFFVTKVLDPLGADTSASRYLEPDGHFPNHIPNPENKDAMNAIRAAVLEGGCDFGIIFDTDVDRAGAVDENGNELSRNRFIALMAAIVAEQAPHSTIVTDSVTSAQLKTYIENTLGLKHHRFKRGYKNVINEAIRLNREGEETLLAIETSGHGALKENYFLDDGAYLSAKLLIKLSKLRAEGSSISELLSTLGEPAEAQEIRLKIACEDFRSYGKQVLNDLEEYAKKQPDWVPATDNHEGFRATVTTADGWFLVRMSLHDPQIPINIESNKTGGVEAIKQQLMSFLSQYEYLK